MKITRELVFSNLPEIREDAHKYDRGRLLVVCGSYGMAGAAVMAGRAALNTGVGYLDMAIPESIYGIVGNQIIEGVYGVYDPEKSEETEKILKERIAKADALVFGSGIGNLRSRIAPIIFRHATCPMVLDADGLNALAFLSNIPENKSADLVLTPHEGEAARLLKTDSTWIREHREEAIQRIAEEYEATVLMKGPKTLIYQPGKELMENITGNPGLARAGSGDVLSGIIGALMAQKMNGYQACIAGAYLHGAVADRLVRVKGMRSLCPMDVAENIWQELMEE